MSEWIVAARLERGLAVAQRPGARLLLAGREERDQAERVLEPPHDLVERRRRPSRNAAASSSESSASSASSLQSIPPGPLTIAISGFVVSGSSSAGQLARPLGQRLARPRGARGPRAGPRPPCARSRSPDFACFSTRSSRLRDVIACRRRAARASASRGRSRDRRAGEKPSATASSASTWRRPPSSAGPVPGTSCTRIAAGRHLLRARRAPRAARAARRRSWPCRRSTCPSRTRTR